MNRRQAGGLDRAIQRPVGATASSTTQAPPRAENPGGMPGDVTPGKTEGWLTGLEPATPRITIGGNVVLSAAGARLTSSTPDACAAACAKSPADAPVVPAAGSPDRLDIVARAVALVAAMPLSDADRAGVLDRVLAGNADPAAAAALKVRNTS